NIGRFPNESQGDAGLKLRSHLQRKEQPPARSRQGYRDDTHRYNKENSPPDVSDCMANRIQPGPSRNSDERDESHQPSNYTGSLSHLSPNPCKFGPQSVFGTSGTEMTKKNSLY